ncbi:DUF4359 domain-containing protein [Kamptonema cortianum]|uniref:DUF4359 domain-containing protein n=1 Tax=Geitlerinema calcuttense NRMC-F 0142 TaxID=2922238 RepID=A0ABT7M1N1_9CYAN|nr:DUF4359 domain-containing protein [Geitlerinema calcuttense]MCD8488262.1 DUF4359 domain-containing protein [Desertifilum sp.]MDK3159142.1 DUF4359 domain-containing protein [Kamptonema cortianum]MDL5057752.1 DUF4359 domain-containing protein [Geitlerinema calcuttense NRMC-F 0142]
MKGSNPIIYIGGAVLAGLGVLMVATNPSPRAYEEYAALELSRYAKTNLCTQQNPFGSFLQGQCIQLVDAAQPQVRSLVAQTTQRKNLGVLSIYRTELSVISLLPSYEFETVGVLNNFYTFKAQKR